ncbi:hypothetical protein AAG906_024713 [Vitis piasezkii]
MYLSLSLEPGAWSLELGMGSKCLILPPLVYAFKDLGRGICLKFAKENKLDLVAINPGLVIGPLLQPALNTSVEPVLKLINGTQTFPNTTYRGVDVRDVANARIQAVEVPSANGRYCLVSRVADCSEVVKILHELYPTSNLPDK